MNYITCKNLIFPYFLYMAKKRGRKKKRGPKKKKPIVINKYVGLPRPYHIITANNGIQLKDIYSAVSIDVALNKLRELQEKFNKNILFPVRFVSNKEAKTFIEADYKLILIKKKFEEGEYEGKVKNEYGRYIDCVTSSENWLFIEEAPYKIEETFWVYGYNPKTDRKTYKFIIDNYMTYDKHNKYFFKEVIVYRNKVLIESNDNLNMIICKNHQDSVRLYNELYDYCKKEKYKNIVFGGDINQFSYSSELWFEKIQKLTNWSRRKINKNSTRD